MQALLVRPPLASKAKACPRPVNAAASIVCTEAIRVVSQNANAFTVLAAEYTCTDGQINTLSGGGTVDGDQFFGQFDTVSNFGWTASQYFSGAVTGSTINLSQVQISYTGSLVGTCTYSPPLEYTGTIAPAGTP